LEYDVIKGGKVIGQVVTDRKVNEDTVTINLVSETKFRMLFSFTVYYQFDETYLGEILLFGAAESTLNGVTQKKARVWQEGEKYESELDGSIYSLSEQGIDYSVGQIYHQEPNERSRIFSQNFAAYLEIEKIEEHKYVLHSDDGKNIYTYENGICVHVKVNRPYATFYFELKTNEQVR
jgi:hypothetical protein